MKKFYTVYGSAIWHVRANSKEEALEIAGRKEVDEGIPEEAEEGES